MNDTTEKYRDILNALQRRNRRGINHCPVAAEIISKFGGGN